jgi:hypothetical protein
VVTVVAFSVDGGKSGANFYDLRTIFYGNSAFYQRHCDAKSCKFQQGYEFLIENMDK